MRPRSRGFPLLTAAALAATSTLASPGHAQRVFRAETQMVQVTITVTDRDGRLVTSLGRDDFIVHEDGVEQTVRVLTTDRLPVSLGILVDVSDSMFGRRIADARAALDRFVLDLLAPNDEAFLMVFNHAPRLIAPWTYPPRRLAQKLADVRPFGGTAIYDALIAAVPQLATRRHQRCGLVIISDGEDSASDATLYDAVRTIGPTDAFVYAIAIDEPSGPAIARKFSPQALNDITGPTGGYTESIGTSADLPRATERIASELNHQYMLGYMPNHAPDGKYHGIHVRVRNAGYLVRARRGYVDTPRAFR